VTHALVEVRAFLRAALLSPVPGIAEDPPESRPRRRWVVAATLLVGAVASAATLRIEPGDGRFYWAAIGLAVVWAAGAFASGPVHLGTGRTRAHGYARPLVPSLILGVLAVAFCLLAAVLVARAPTLREPVDDLLDHARFGSLPAVLVITVLNGIAEELYFRGALYAALRRTHPVAVTTVLYALTTVGSGVPLLVIAALMVGLLTALQRRVTGGVLGPIIIHLTWSVGMLLLLPPVLESAR
jgi:membrane protease YdiL (CAAX protease family)